MEAQMGTVTACIIMAAMVYLGLEYDGMNKSDVYLALIVVLPICVVLMMLDDIEH
jgi:hypothetical protein